MLRWDDARALAPADRPLRAAGRREIRRLGPLIRLVLLLCLLAGGCQNHWESDYQSLRLLDVSGKITLDGRPLGHATVIFEGPDRSDSRGVTDGAGRYRLQFDSNQAGVLPGPKVVRIQQQAREPDSDASSGAQTNRAFPQQREFIPACYNSASHLHATVTESSHSFDFHLRSDCTVTGPAR